MDNCCIYSIFRLLRAKKGGRPASRAAGGAFGILLVDDRAAMFYGSTS
jgi:hypothetical protein